MAKALSPLAVELVSARESLAFWRKQVLDLSARLKHERFALANDKLAKREAKAEARRNRESLAALKRENAIAKAQIRLQRLLDKQAQPVGVKALKANRKPSKAVVTEGAEANAIAAAIMAKKAKA